MKQFLILIAFFSVIGLCLSTTNTTNSSTNSNSTNDDNLCSKQLIDQVSSECLNSTGKTMAFYTCFRNKTQDIPNCYSNGCTMLQNEYITFTCPPPALNNCTNATVFPLASTCYAWSNQTYKWLECMQWYLFNTEGCIQKVCDFTSENYPQLKCPEFLSNATEKFETQFFTYAPEYQYQMSNGNNTNNSNSNSNNRLSNSSLVCAPETVQPLVMQCFNKTGKTLKFYTCLQQVLASSPDCYEHTCQYMENKISGFTCPPAAITSCSNESVYEMNQKCMQWADNSDAKWYECMKFYLFNSQECLYQVCENPSDFSSQKYACPQINQQYAQFMTAKNTECNQQTIKPIVQGCYNKTGNNTNFFTCLKSSLVNIENCYETSCHYLEEHTSNIKCPPKKLDKCNFETVSPIITKCLKKTGNNVQWYDCIKWYLFETDGCYKSQCVKFAKTLKGFKCPDV